MEDNRSKLLLLIGCQRSGTSLLTAMLGRHSEINMLYESTSSDVLHRTGKRYSGNKLLTWRQIRMTQRASKLGHLVNRIVNFHFRGERHHKLRIYPTSSLSIQDYLNKGAAIIVAVRNKEEVISSITSRTDMTVQQAVCEYDRSMKIIEELGTIAHRVDFYDLIHQPGETLKEICLHLELSYEEQMMEGVEFNVAYPGAKLDKSRSKNRYNRLLQ